MCYHLPNNSTILLSPPVQRVIRVWRVTYLCTALLAAFFSGLTQLAVSSLLILLGVFVYLRLNIIVLKLGLRIRTLPPVGVQDLLQGWLNEIEVSHLSDVPVAHFVELDVAHVCACQDRDDLTILLDLS